MAPTLTGSAGTGRRRSASPRKAATPGSSTGYGLRFSNRSFSNPQILEGHPRGFLLRFLLAGSARAGQRLPAHNDLHFEPLLVVGPERAEQPVFRQRLAARLHELLQS